MDETIGFCAIILCVCIVIVTYNSHTERMYKLGACKQNAQSFSAGWVPCDKIK